jgi:hypothetical protein
MCKACSQFHRRINCEALSVSEIMTVQPITRPRRKQTNVLVRTEIPDRRMYACLRSARFRQRGYRVRHLFWRLRNEIFVKCVCERRHVSACSSVCPCVTSPVPLSGFSRHVISGSSVRTDICRQFQFWLKSDKSHRNFTWGPVAFVSAFVWIVTRQIYIRAKNDSNNTFSEK